MRHVFEKNVVTGETREYDIADEAEPTRVKSELEQLKDALVAKGVLSAAEAKL